MSRGCAHRVEPLLDAVAVRTRSVVLDFPSAGALYGQLVAPADRKPEVRAAFDALLPAANDRPAATPWLSAPYLLVTGVVKARRDTLRGPAA